MIYDFRFIIPPHKAFSFYTLHFKFYIFLSCFFGFAGNHPLRTLSSCSKISLIVQKEEKANTPSKEDHNTFVTHKAAIVPTIPKTRKIHQHPVPQYYSALITTG